MRHSSPKSLRRAIVGLGAFASLHVSSNVAHAQASPPIVYPAQSNTSVTFALGAQHVAQRNHAVSSLRFAGTGTAGTLRLRRARPRYSLLTDVSAGALSLGSPRVASVARLSFAELDVSLNRAMSTRHSVRIDGGLAMSAHATLSKHEFAVVRVSPTRSRIASVSFGPRVGVQRIERWGTVHGAVALPAIAIVDRPYAASKSAYAGFSPRLVSARDAQTFVGDASFTSSSRARLGVQIAVRSRFFAHNDGEPVRALANTYSAGFVIRSRRLP